MLEHSATLSHALSPTARAAFRFIEARKRLNGNAGPRRPDVAATDGLLKKRYLFNSALRTWDKG